MTISVSGSVMIASSPIEMQRQKRFPWVRNCDEETVPRITIAKKATTSPASQRTSARVRSVSSGRLTEPPPAKRRGQLEQDQPVDRDRDEDQHPLDRLRPERRDADDVERGEDRAQEQRA